MGRLVIRVEVKGYCQMFNLKLELLFLLDFRFVLKNNSENDPFPCFLQSNLEHIALSLLVYYKLLIGLLVRNI